MTLTDQQTLKNLKKFFLSEISFDAYVKKCEEALKSFSPEIKVQAIEYYALITAQDHGHKLTPEELERCFELLDVVCEYDITPLSFSQDLFQKPMT